MRPPPIPALLLLFCLFIASIAGGQTKNVIKTITGNALTEPLVVPSGVTLTINSGASIVNNGTATGFAGTTLPWTSITGKPTTLAGFGITDALTTSQIQAGYQPIDSDLTSIAGLTTTSFGRSLLTQADAAATRTTLGLGTLATQNGSLSDYLTTATAASTYLTSATAASTYLTTATAASTYVNSAGSTSFGRSLLTEANNTSLRSTLGLGTLATQNGNLSDYLTTATAASTYLTSATAASTYLTAATAASTYLTTATAASTYLTSATAASTYLASAGSTVFGRSLLTQADAAATRTTLGLGSIATQASTSFVAAAPAVSDVLETTLLTINSAPGAGDGVALWSLAYGPATVYYFVLDGSGGPPGSFGGQVAISLSATPTAEQTRDALITAINNAGEFTATTGGTGVSVLVTEKTAGPGRTINITEFAPTFSYSITTPGQLAAPRRIEAINGSQVTDVDAATLSGDTKSTILSQAATSAESLALASANQQRGLALLATATASSSSSVTFDNTFTNTYDSYMLVAEGVRPATDNVALRVTLRNGSSDMTNNYRWGFTFVPLTSGAAGNTVNQLATTGWTPLSTNIGNDVNEFNSFEMIIHPRNSVWKHMNFRSVYVSTTATAWALTGGGLLESTTDATGVRIYMSTGNIATGRFKLYGLKRTL